MATTEVRARRPLSDTVPGARRSADGLQDVHRRRVGRVRERRAVRRLLTRRRQPDRLGAQGHRQDVQKAIAAATKAQKEMAKLSIPARSKLLFKASEIAYRRLEHDARVLCRECGKTITEARDEIEHYSAPHFIEAAEGIKRYRGRINPSIQEDTLNKRILVIRQPMGVIGIISPWNWPHDIPNIAATHALAAGNAVILKPASTTPYSALMLAEIYEEAGFPAGLGQRGHRAGRRRRRGAGQQSGHQRHPLHRRDGDRRAPHPHRRHQAAHARARRQRSARGHGRRQHRGGRGSHDHRLLLPGRPGVHRL